jgi:ABC-type transport system involved in multi-copper enzyme maturation permease subunit
MRGPRAFMVLTGMLLLLGIVSYALYRIVLATNRYSPFPMSPQIGQTLFAGLALLELMVICFVTPAVTAGAISGEQEKLTYEMLMATPLRPASILWGKLVSALSYVFLLVFAAVPMASLVFIFGGVAPRDMLKALIVLVTASVTLGVIGVFMSTWLGRTGRATVLSYLVVLALLIGPYFVYILVGVLRQMEPPRWILIPNPVAALFSALTPSTPAGGGGVLGSLGMVLSGNIRVLTGQRGMPGIPRPLYHYTLPLYGFITLALYLLATRLVQPARRWRIGMRGVLTALAALALFSLAAGLAFLATAGRYERVSIFATPTPIAMPAEVPAPMVVREAVRAVEVEAPPTPTPAPTPTWTPQAVAPGQLPGSLSADEEAEVYAAVVRQLYSVDHTFDQPPNFPVVYLVRTTDDRVGDPDAPQAKPQTLSEALQDAILVELDDLPADFVWVDGEDEVPREGGAGAVLNEGAIITLGNIHVQDDGSALVSARLYFAMLGATGKTYVLERIDGAWRVTGDTGVQWIS